MYYWQQPKRNKYGNKKVEYMGQTFDSKKELNRYLELSMLEKGGIISNLKTQVEFILIPNQYEPVEKILKSGKVKIEQKLIEHKLSYIADFTYQDKQGNLVVEDVKSDITRKMEKYIIKRKLMLYLHKLKISEI